MVFAYDEGRAYPWDSKPFVNHVEAGEPIVTDKSSLLCFAHGSESGWEALCVDFDIAVQGDSFDDVKLMLDTAVQEYVRAIDNEAPADRLALLNRRAPWWVTLNLTARLIAHNVFRGRGGEAQASFPVLCPA